MKSRAGFTLIELLVTISIIGVLSSVVLASLNGARSKTGVAAGQEFEHHTYSAYFDEILVDYDFTNSFCNSSKCTTDGSSVTSVIDSGQNNKTLIRESNLDIPSFDFETPVSKSKSLKFEGTEHLWYFLQSMPSPKNSKKLSASFWLKTDALSISRIFRINDSLALGKNSSGLVFYLKYPSGNNTIVCQVPFAADSLWHHVFATINAENSKVGFYIDGRLTSNNCPSVSYSFSQWVNGFTSSGNDKALVVGNESNFNPPSSYMKLNHLTIFADSPL